MCHEENNCIPLLLQFMEWAYFLFTSTDQSAFSEENDTSINSTNNKTF
jgi:hypothetical protein